MQILGIKYASEKKTQSMVIIILVEHEHKFSCLRSNLLTNSEINLIRESSAILNNFNTHHLIEWFKKNIPSYKYAYRELKKVGTTIIDRYDI